MTAIVYLTGGPESTYFTVYIFYAVVAGMLYSHVVALAVSVISVAIYVAFSILCRSGVIPPMLVAMDGMVSPAVRSPYFYPVLLMIFSGLAVYTTKISSHFTQVRERMLEARNKELTALHQMSNAIRGLLSLESVLWEILQGVMKGLDFSLTMITLFDKDTQRIKCHPPKDNEVVKRIEELVQFPLDRLSLPIDALENSALRSLKQNQMIFRRDMAELLTGLEPQIPAGVIERVQKEFNIRKMVAVPLVAEGNVIGALFGFTKMYFIGERMVETLESFANQAAMAIQTSQLISELRRKNVALQEANRVKSEFLATMSHELRTPLTAIIGFSELLLEGVMGELNDEQKDSVREVLNNGANLLDMINNLLDLAKADSGKMDLAISSFDLKDLLERSSHAVAALLHRKQHKIRYEVEKDMPLMNADEKRVQQTILNLLSNAIKFTPDGGEITIAARFIPSVDDAIKKGELVCPKAIFGEKAFFVSVSDTGIGIKEEHLEIIFDVFSQVDSGATRSYEGTGLGLALARQFVELHGGVIWAESAYGKGAKFLFVIPQRHRGEE